ncbi:transcription factor Ken 2-like isoform X2 [Adelges cooleyi]|nr:transcription factor Ken 2-like isoform X2 [Adelges cooleyi]
MLLPTNVLIDENYVTEEEDDYQWWTEEDLWKFPPPPPRPPFLEPPYSDGLTTCDLCTWALQPLDGTDNGMLTVPIAEVTWPMILVLVSLLSAAIGALFMVVFLHLKLRLSGRTAPSRPECLVSFEPPTDRVHHHHHHHHQQHQRRILGAAAGDTQRRGPVRRSGQDTTSKYSGGPGRPAGGNGLVGGRGNRDGGHGGGGGGDGGGVGGGAGRQLLSAVNPGDWFRWFRRKRRVALPPNAVPPNQIVRANHYTVEEAAAAIPVVVYASVIGQDDVPVVDDVLYTELDRVPTPAYHNAGYAFDQHSSAYYSDMYEPIDPYHQRHNSLPSDYV